MKDYAIYMLDPSGVVVNWNSGAERLKGYTAEEIVGQHFSKFYTREDRAAGLPARVLEPRSATASYEAEGWRVRKDGSRFWASVVVDAIRDENGELIGFAKITRDITERQAAQQTLRESERQFRLLVRGVTDYALFMLDPNGLVVKLECRRANGSRAIPPTRSSASISRASTPSAIAPRACRRARCTPPRKKGRYEAEGWRVRKDGSLFWANVIIDPIRDENGTLIGFAKITRDITERRDAQMALQEAQAQRAQAQKMEALGQLDRRRRARFQQSLDDRQRPLADAQEARRRRRKGPPRRRGDRARGQARRALTRQLLTFSRRQTFNPTLTNSSERIEAFRNMLATSLDASTRLVGQRFRRDLAGADRRQRIRAGARQPGAECARRDAAQGGVITISAENVELTPQQTPARLQGEFVALSVADTGSRHRAGHSALGLRSVLHHQRSEPRATA